MNDMTTEFLQCPPENEAMRRAQQWFAEGRHLSWLPIFSQANFPGVPIDILEWADRAPFQSAWPISRLEDFMGLPPGITGWLLPEGDDDTDMVVAVWEGIAHFLSVRDLRTGDPQTLMSGRNREMEGQGGIPVKDVGTYPNEPLCFDFCPVRSGHASPRRPENHMNRDLTVATRLAALPTLSMSLVAGWLRKGVSATARPKVPQTSQQSLASKRKLKRS